MSHETAFCAPASSQLEIIWNQGKQLHQMKIPWRPDRSTSRAMTTNSADSVILTLLSAMDRAAA